MELGPKIKLKIWRTTRYCLSCQPNRPTFRRCGRITVASQQRWGNSRDSEDSCENLPAIEAPTQQSRTFFTGSKVNHSKGRMKNSWRSLESSSESWPELCRLMIKFGSLSSNFCHFRQMNFEASCIRKTRPETLGFELGVLPASGEQYGTVQNLLPISANDKNDQ